MKTIYKYNISLSHSGMRAKMPATAVITHTDMTEEGLNVWALVEKDDAPTWRYFIMHKTGEELPDSIADCLLIKTMTSRAITKAPVFEGDVVEFRTLVDHLWQVSEKTFKEYQAIKSTNY